jgi:nucleoid-associated protein YgaU
MVWVAVIIGVGVWAYLIVAWNPWLRARFGASGFREALSTTATADGNQPRAIWTEITDVESLDNTDDQLVSQPDPNKFKEALADPALAPTDTGIDQSAIGLDPQSQTGNRMTVNVGGSGPRAPVADKTASGQQAISEGGKSDPGTTVSAKDSGPGNASAPRARTYVVQKGDTLSKISERLLGSSRHWKKIQEANKGKIDPSNLRVGAELVIPEIVAASTESVSPSRSVAAVEAGSQKPAADSQKIADISSGAAVSAKPPTQQTAAKETGRTYVVAQGDTLVSIAKRFYGQQGNWQKIHQANAGILPKAHALRPGMKIVLP